MKMKDVSIVTVATVATTYILLGYHSACFDTFLYSRLIEGLVVLLSLNPLGGVVFPCHNVPESAIRNQRSVIDQIVLVFLFVTY